MFTYGATPALLAFSLAAPMFTYGATLALLADSLETPMFTYGATLALLAFSLETPMFAYGATPALLALSLAAPVFTYGAAPAFLAVSLAPPVFTSFLGFWMSLCQQLLVSQQHIFFCVEIRERQGLPPGIEHFFSNIKKSSNPCGGMCTQWLWRR